MEPENDDDGAPRYGWRLSTGGAGLHAQAAERAKDDPPHRARFVLYGGSEVRFHPMYQAGGDVIETSSLQLKRYHTNPVALLEHNPDLVIGTGQAEISGERLLWTVDFDVHESNPTAILVAHQHAAGIRRAVSIGFMPGRRSLSRADLPKSHPWRLDVEEKWRAGMYYRDAEMYEGSSVSIPKDPSALQLQSWALAASSPEGSIERMAAEVLPQRFRSLLLDAVRNDADIRRAVLALTLGDLPIPGGHAGKTLDDWWPGSARAGG